MILVVLAFVAVLSYVGKNVNESSLVGSVVNAAYHISSNPILPLLIFTLIIVGIKGQVAVEFLATYSWAILVVLVAIGALAYFGVLSPEKFLPAKCTLPAGVACTDFKIDSTANTVSVALRNGIGYDLTLVSIAAGQCGEGPTQSLNNGDQATFTTVATGCSPALVGGQKFNEELQLKYTNSNTGIDHSVNGTITGRIE